MIGTGSCGTSLVFFFPTSSSDFSSDDFKCPSSSSDDEDRPSLRTSLIGPSQMYKASMVRIQSTRLGAFAGGSFAKRLSSDGRGSASSSSHPQQQQLQLGGGGPSVVLEGEEDEEMQMPAGSSLAHGGRGMAADPIGEVKAAGWVKLDGSSVQTPPHLALSIPPSPAPTEAHSTGTFSDVVARAMKATGKTPSGRNTHLPGSNHMSGIAAHAGINALHVVHDMVSGRFDDRYRRRQQREGISTGSRPSCRSLKEAIKS